MKARRNLSDAAAAACEKACKPRCRCRCKGALHGAGRGEDRAFFEQLPEDDPHHVREKPAPRIKVKPISRRARIIEFDRARQMEFPF